MRSIFAAFLAALLFLAVPPAAVRARADTLRYAVAADSNVWFYAAESESERLFLVPETYYVRVLSEGEVYTAVEYLVNDAPYKKVMGYCRTDALTFVDFIPARPFLRKQITVTYTLEGSGSLGGEFSGVEKTFVYYGMRYENGQLYFYVLSDGKFGYIPAEAPIEFERNDDWLSVPTPPASGEADPPMSGEGASVWQIVAICAVAVCAIVVAALVVKGKKSPPHDADDL